MLPPKEKAKELVDKFYQATPNATTLNPVELNKEVARQCALICVNEIIAATYMNVNKYFRQVKEEI